MTTLHIKTKCLSVHSHYSGSVIKLDLFSNIFCLDVLILVCNENDTTFFFPPVLVHPMHERMVFDVAQQFGQFYLVDCLECRAGHVADELANRIVEPGDPRTKFRHRVHSRPELLEVAALKYVGQVHYLVDGCFCNL